MSQIVCFPGARAAVLDNLNRQREEGRLCDLSIQVQGQVFRAHRCVLAASSPYFHDQNVTTVSLPSVMDPLAFESVLSSAYTGQLSIVHDDIVNYVTVASFLQMWHIVDKCTEILKRPRPSVEVTPGEATAANQGTASRQQSPSSTDSLGPSCPVSARQQWQSGPWSQQEQRPQQGEGGSCSKDEDEDEDEEDIEDGTGQVSQRPLVPVSPDFTMAGSEVHWPSTSVGQTGSLTPTSSRHLSPSSAAFPPASSPPTPSSSSSVSLAGAPYTGKVHFCHCGKAYTLKSMRDRHVKMQHLNLRPFGCPVCTKSFKMKHHLTKHLKTHGGLRPYECGLCGKKVIWRDSFLRHQARCERLASSSSANSSNANTAAAGDMDGSFSYGFDEGEAFLATGGQVKVEEVDFHGEMEDGMRGLLGSVSGIVDELRSQSQNLDSGSHVFKEEASESFSGN
uniref:Zinc finger and BTB domain containing 22a n=1 Tax=Seriola lalandi dorsalis TaxID=1841481 RepID=A0A3B4YF29_SERLL